MFVSAFAASGAKYLWQARPLAIRTCQGIAQYLTLSIYRMIAEAAGKRCILENANSQVPSFYQFLR
jgi:hypothetical protein